MNTREPDTDNTGVGMHMLKMIAAAWLFEFKRCPVPKNPVSRKAF